MRIAIVVTLSLLLVGCGGMEGMNTRRMTNAELKSRYSSIERGLGAYQAGETDATRLRHYQDLVREEQDVSGELYRRCRAGDQDACLPGFRMIHE
jgi:hypothetical protein